MNSKKKLGKYFKGITRQSKRRISELDIKVDIPSEVAKNYYNLACSTLNYEKIVDESTKIISAFAANNYAKESISKIENSIFELVNKYPKYYWKFYITAIPKEHFKGRLDTTFLFAIKMIESCISFSEKEIDNSELYKNGDSVLLDINESVVKDYCTLVGYSRLLVDMYVLIRTSSKGCQFHICEKTLMLKPIDENLVFESIKLFDNRNVIESKVASGINIPTKSGFSLKQKQLNKIGNLIIAANENQAGGYEYVPKKLTKLKDTKYTKVNFNIGPISLETIYKEFDYGKEGLPWEIELLEVISLMQFTTSLIINGGVFIPDIAEKGYFLFPKGFIEQYFQGFIESVKEYQLEKLGITFTINANEIKQKYSRPLNKNIYPGNASMIFDAGKMLGFDISSSLEIFFNKLEYTKKQGKIANLRGSFFEKQIQELIDGSKLKPENKIRNLVAKTIRFDGKSITDFDAIMVSRNNLIAISCKSLLVDENYDKGDYKTIRNVTGSIEKYVEDWREKIKLVNENRMGDNYDFSNFDKVVGLVVTPSVLYCNVIYRNELELQGLYDCMSSCELESWINITND